MPLKCVLVFTELSIYFKKLTCKIHFILSPGAIITVVQTPAKKPDVKI